MKWTAALAIYALFWVMTAFFVFPFHARKVRGLKSKAVSGQEAGAPPVFLAGWIGKWTTIWATGAFLLYYLAYTREWINLAALLDSIGPS